MFLPARKNQRFNLARSRSEFARPAQEMARVCACAMSPTASYKFPSRYNAGSTQQRAPAQPRPDFPGEPQRNRGPIASTNPSATGARIAPASPGKITALRFVHDHFWRGLCDLNLGAHFLDLRGLLFELSRQDFHSFRLLSDRCL
jgi:hypothetical protein